MTEEDKTRPWYMGDTDRPTVQDMMECQPEGTFTVFRPNDRTDIYLLCFKAYGKVNFQEILHDGLYGFAEPLQFDCIESALDTFNNNELSRYYGMLTAPLHKQQVSIHRTESIYKKPPSRDNPAPAALLRRLRETDKLRGEKDEEICDMQAELKQKHENLEKVSTRIKALYNVMKTLEKQTERHKLLESKLQQSTIPSDQKDLSDNYARIMARRAQLEREITRTEEKRSELETSVNKLIYDKHLCVEEVARLQQEFDQTKQEVLDIYPDFEEFIDNLLAEDTHDPFTAQPRNVEKAKAKEYLEDREEGTFIIWNNNTPREPFCISIRFDDPSGKRKFKHFPVLKQDGYYGFDETTCIFNSLSDLVFSYGKIPFRLHDDSFGDLTLRYEWSP